jgi:hypothetical protein
MVAPKHAGSPTHAVGNPAFVASKRALRDTVDAPSIDEGAPTENPVEP